MATTRNRGVKNKYIRNGHPTIAPQITKLDRFVEMPITVSTKLTSTAGHPKLIRIMTIMLPCSEFVTSRTMVVGTDSRGVGERRFVAGQGAGARGRGDTLTLRVTRRVDVSVSVQPVRQRSRLAPILSTGGHHWPNCWSCIAAHRTRKRSSDITSAHTFRSLRKLPAFSQLSSVAHRSRPSRVRAMSI